MLIFIYLFIYFYLCCIYWKLKTITKLYGAHMWPIQLDWGATEAAGGDVLWLCGETQQIFNDIVQYVYKAGGVWQYEPPQDRLYYWLKYLLARWEPNGEDWPHDFYLLQTLKGGMLGRTLRGEPRGPKGSQGTRLRLTKAVRGRAVSTPPPPTPTPKPPPSVICMLEKQRQDSTERAAAFIFSIPPVPSVVRVK